MLPWIPATGWSNSGDEDAVPNKWVQGLWVPVQNSREMAVAKVGKAGALHLLLGMVLTGFQMPRAFFLPRQSSRETPHKRCPAECGISPGLGPTQLQVPKPAVPRVEGPAPASRCDLGAMGRTVQGQEALRASLVPCANVQQLRCPQLPGVPNSRCPPGPAPHTAPCGLSLAHPSLSLTWDQSHEIPAHGP